MARATLKEIARLANVSVSTVSLALSGKGKISAQQVERIRKIADEMGYTPSPLLASLASKRFRTGEAALGNMIAILAFPYSRSADRATNIYRDDLLRYARELGYNPQLFDRDSIRAYTDLPGTLYRRGTLGVIISGQPDAELFADHSRWRHFSLVQCGRYLSPLPIDTARPDIFTAIKLVFHELRALGYRRIGFGCGVHDPILEDDEARHGAALALQSLYCSKKESVPLLRSLISDSEAFIEWVKRHRPDAVIGFSPGQWWLLRDAGFRIPEDIGFASLHLHMREGRMVDPNIAGLLQRTDQIARQSVILLDQLIRHNERGFPKLPHQMLIAPVWCPAPSVCARPASASD